MSHIGLVYFLLLLVLEYLLKILKVKKKMIKNSYNEKKTHIYNIFPILK